MNSKQLIERHYTDSFDIYRLGASTNAWGNTADQVYAEASTGNAGKLQARAGDKGQANSKDEYITTHIVYCGIAVDVQPEKDQVRFGTDKYKVTYAQKGTGVSNFGRHQEVGLLFIESIQV